VNEPGNDDERMKRLATKEEEAERNMHNEGKCTAQSKERKRVKQDRKNY